MVNLNEAMGKIKAQLLADKKKAGILCALSLVLMIALVRAMIKETGPEAISAADAIIAKPDKPIESAAGGGVELIRPRADPSVTTSPSPDGTPCFPGSTAASAFAPKNPEPADRIADTRSIPREMQRNPFNTTAWAKFPLDIVTPLKETEEENSSEKEGGPFWTRLARAVEEHQAAREALRSKLERELGELSLQSTMTGVKPLAYISGRLVGEGEEIGGFSVVRISNRQVLLSKSGILQVLIMP